MSGFEDYVRQHGRELVRFACAVTADPGVAEDVVQNVLMRFMRDWSRVEATDSMQAYAHRAIVNEYLSWRRKWARLVPTARVPEPAVSRDLAEDHANRSELATRIAHLPAQQRTAIVLRYYVGYSDAEIATTLNCRQVTVRGYVSRALKQLRLDLTDGVHTSGRTGHGH